MSPPPPGAGRSTGAPGASAAASAAASVWSRCRCVTSPATARPARCAGTTDGTPPPATASPNGANTASTSASGSTTTLSPAASTSTPAQPNHRTLIMGRNYTERSFAKLPAMPRRSATQVAESRAAIVGTAVDQGSRWGLEGLTIGWLADELGMSKSGVVGHFGSKEQLQLAVLDAAVSAFVRDVWEPVADEP